MWIAWFTIESNNNTLISPSQRTYTIESNNNTLISPSQRTFTIESNNNTLISPSQRTYTIESNNNTLINPSQRTYTIESNNMGHHPRRSPSPRRVRHALSKAPPVCVFWQQHISNHSIRERTKQPTASSLLRQRRLRWFGHIHRTPSSLPVRRVYDFNTNIHGWKRPSSPAD